MRPHSLVLSLSSFHDDRIAMILQIWQLHSIPVVLFVSLENIQVVKKNMNDIKGNDDIKCDKFISSVIATDMPVLILGRSL